MSANLARRKTELAKRLEHARHAVQRAEEDERKAEDELASLTLTLADQWEAASNALVVGGGPFRVAALTDFDSKLPWLVVNVSGDIVAAFCDVTAADLMCVALEMSGRVRVEECR